MYTTARGREVVFGQSPRTRKPARPGVSTPTAQAAGLADLTVVGDSHECYGHRLAGKPVTVVRRALRYGDYEVEDGTGLVAAVERKSLPDLVTSLTTGSWACTPAAPHPRVRRTG